MADRKNVGNTFTVNEDMVIYAFRYALGRRSYEVSTVSEYLRANWHRFSDHTKSLILKEIREAIEKLKERRRRLR